jgi:hypothetical protein
VLTGESIKNIFFAKKALNVLVLDAHLTFEHQAVHKYALQKYNLLAIKAKIRGQQLS